MAIRAAMLSASAIRVDLVLELIEDAEELASPAGVEVDWVETAVDVEDLPFENDRFDYVWSYVRAEPSTRRVRESPSLSRGRSNRTLLLVHGRSDRFDTSSDTSARISWIQPNGPSLQVW